MKKTLLLPLIAAAGLFLAACGGDTPASSSVEPDPSSSTPGSSDTGTSDTGTSDTGTSEEPEPTLPDGTYSITINKTNSTGLTTSGIESPLDVNYAIVSGDVTANVVGTFSTGSFVNADYDEFGLVSEGGNLVITAPEYAKIAYLTVDYYRYINCDIYDGAYSASTSPVTAVELDPSEQNRSERRGYLLSGASNVATIYNASGYSNQIFSVEVTVVVGELPTFTDSLGVNVNFASAYTAQPVYLVYDTVANIEANYVEGTDKKEGIPWVTPLASKGTWVELSTADEGVNYTASIELARGTSVYYMVASSLTGNNDNIFIADADWLAIGPKVANPYSSISLEYCIFPDNVNALGTYGQLAIYNSADDPMDPDTFATTMNSYGRSSTTYYEGGYTYLRGVVASSSYNDYYENYEIHFQVAEGNNDVYLYRAVIDSSVTGDFTATNALAGFTVSAYGYACCYVGSSGTASYQLAPAGDPAVSPTVTGVTYPTGYFTVDNDNVVLRTTDTAATVNVAFHDSAYAGGVTVASSATAIATAAVAGNVITITPVAAGSAVVTVTAGENDWTETIDVTIIDVTNPTSTFDFTAQGYENSEVFESLNVGRVAVVAGGSGTTPKWYNSGSAIRFYPGNTITISTISDEWNLSSVVFTFSGSNVFGENETYSAGTYDADTTTLTVSANSVTITIGGSSGNRRISQIVVNTVDATPAV